MSPKNDSELIEGTRYDIDKPKIPPVILNSFGCKQCVWNETTYCPHGIGRDAVYDGNEKGHFMGEVRKEHEFGICEERMELAMMMIEDAKAGLIKGFNGRIGFMKAEQLKKMMDNSILSDMVLKDALKSKDPKARAMVLPWRKFEAEQHIAFIKQEEGSKLEVTTNIMEKVRDTIELTADEVKILEKEDDGSSETSD